MHANVRAETRADASGSPVPARVPNHVVAMAARKRLTPATDLSRRPEKPPTMARRAAEWCLPWSIFSYPGHLRGIRTILGREVPNSSFHRWKWHDNMPRWACERLLTYIEARCRIGLALCDELRDHIKMAGDGPPSKTGAHLRGRGSRDRLPD
jgi:hypothetical protein